MQNSKILLLATLLLLPLAAAAYVPEEGKITATLGPFIYRTDFKGSDSGATSPVLGDVGLIVNGDASKKGALEISMFHMNKIFFRDQGGLYQAEQTQVVHIGMGYRWWLSERWSSALTFYSAYSIGDPVVVHTDFAPGTEIDTSARDLTEYGFDLSVQAELWHNEKYALVLDARYSPTLTAKDSEHENHYGVLLGFKYVVQEKETPSPRR